MIKIKSLDKSLKFDNQVLTKLGKKYNGRLFTNLESGKKLSLEYEKGLLKIASLSKGKEIQIKTYSYDKNNRLLNVKKDFKDVFIKEIKHNIGLEYTREEKINDLVSKTYDKSNKLIKYIISPKLIFGFIKYFENQSIETRFFLNKAKYMGKGHIQLKYNEGDPILNNGVVDRTIIRMNNGSRAVFLSDDRNLKGKFINHKGEQCVELNFLVDKNSNPIWIRANDKENKWNFDKKILYDVDGNKFREILIENNGKSVTENTYNKGNIILSRKLNSKGKQIQKSEFKYNDKNLLINTKTFDKNNKLIECIKNIFDKNNVLRKQIITYYDNFGTYKNIYEYNKLGNLFKLAELYDDILMESFYDNDEKLIKCIEKDYKKKIKNIHEYFYNDIDKIKTVVKNNKNECVYIIEHTHSCKNDTIKDINIFRSTDDKLLGKEFIIHSNHRGTQKIFYTNAKGKIIKYDILCKIIGDKI